MPHRVPRKRQSLPQNVFEAANIRERKYRYPCFITMGIER